MAYMSYEKIWRSEFFKKVSEEDRMQDINLNQIKLKVNDTYDEVEEKRTNFEPSNVEDVINKASLDTNLSKIEGGSSITEKE